MAVGTPLLSAAILARIKSALANVFATFAREPIVLKKRTVGFNTADFGEKTTATFVPYNLEALYQYTTAHDGKYDIVQRTDKGAEEHDGFRLYLWREDMEATGLLAIDPEVDHVVFMGKEYVIDFAAPSAQFSSLGYLMWEVEVRFRHRT